MYAVSAPANSCDEPSDIKPDNSDTTLSPPAPKHGGGDISSPEPSNEVRVIDGSELAAKILQLHAASQEIETAVRAPLLEARSPRLLDHPGDTDLDIPGILSHPKKCLTPACGERPPGTG